MLTKRPYWADDVLHGLSYWIGYQRSFYRMNEQPELAIKAEACKLLQAHLQNGYTLYDEVMYKRMVPEKKTVSFGLERVDLVICKKREKCGASNSDSKNNSMYSDVQCAIEIKRYTGNNLK